MVQLTEEKMAHIKELRKKAMKLPLHPGVYIMHSRDDSANVNTARTGGSI